jgi:hypothetical protein
LPSTRSPATGSRRLRPSSIECAEVFSRVCSLTWCWVYLMCAAITPALSSAVSFKLELVATRDLRCGQTGANKASSPALVLIVFDFVWSNAAIYCMRMVSVCRTHSVFCSRTLWSRLLRTLRTPGTDYRQSVEFLPVKVSWSYD